ncbi:GTP-binding protein [Cryobacterium sp. PH29-G1]|uniref:GTP-binding protein n=1 Tax=Cryobacterium sp. PH29-G1 TaxID=3046211 RepID=UPI0024B9A571|nr:GTP-binding protein [Cryobacterium sp. PH29-G1]MDJ0350364.1 GTP-binding protein [Cryobacterium sp. PH29-G1]
MQTETYLRVNVVSGLAGAGKTSVACSLGHHPFALTTSISDALRTVLSEVSDAVPARRGEASAIDVFVEAPTAVGPLEIASSLVETGDSPERLANGHAVRLGDLITVLDAARFWRDLRGEALAPTPQTGAGEASDDAATTIDTPGDAERTVGDLLIEQIEWASIVVVNKTDLVRQRDAADIRDFVRLLNPASHIVFAEYGQGGADGWPLPRRDMFAWLQRSPGWVRQLNGDALLARSPQGLTCVVYRDVRPFHPVRLAEFFRDHAEEAGEILRSRGLFRLATRPSTVGSWSSAGPTITFEPTGMHSHDPDSPLGQEIAFFGRNLNAHVLSGNLDDCLLTDAEFLAGPMFWSTLGDPFPGWVLEGAA